MIFTLLILYNYCVSLLKYVNSSKSFEKDDWAVIIDLPKIVGNSSYDIENDLKFSPPLFLQRYEFVKKLIKAKIEKSNNIRKVIDFGCSNIKFFAFIKHVVGIEEYVGVDIDEDLLRRHCSNVNPLTFDYLKRRTEPLNVQVLCGSVAKPDQRLLNADVVVAIELIEHLFPNALEALPYNIFGLIQPEIAIFTTPNCEYNIFFPNFTGFRHDDHKFEWTREQFQSWANNLVLRYPNYKVVFSGLGEGPNNRKEFGYCTQIAVFFRNKIKVDTSSQFSDVYKVIKQVNYPFITETERLKERIQNETEYFIFTYSKLDCFKNNDVVEIPLREILNSITQECDCSEEYLRKFLKTCGWEVGHQQDGTNVLIVPTYGEEDLDNSYTSSATSLEDNANDTFLSDEENWDLLPSVIVMDPTHKSKGEVSDKDSGSSSAETQHEVPLVSSQSNASSLTTRPGSTNLNNGRVSFQTEEDRARSSSDIVSHDHETSNNCLSLNSGSVVTVKAGEDPLEKSAIFVRTSLQKCHSLENVNKVRSKNNPYRFSLNIDKYKFIDCDIGSSRNNDIEKVSSALSVSETFAPRQEDSCSQSKAADSGYPNSYGGQDMDMDLTPEQVDEIITESESSFDGDVDDESGGEEDDPMEIHAEIVRLGENVENGDVANNNRDGEGNNMEAVGAGGGELQFEQVIAEEEIAVGNMAAAVAFPLDYDEDLQFGSFGDVRFNAVVAAIENEREEGQEMQQSLLAPDPSIEQELIFIEDNNAGRFPNWLLNILLENTETEDDDDGAGDAETLRLHGDFPGEDGSHNDDDSVVSDVEQLSDLELFNEPPIELLVHGDLLGGGEPPPIP